MLTAAATQMFAEAAEAPQVVRRQGEDAKLYAELAERLRKLAPPFAYTCARGSSDHAATYAKFLFETRLGLPVVSQAPSIASVYADALTRSRNALFLVISQSGQSLDLLRSAEAARAAGAFVVAMVNVEGSPLADLADFVVPLRAEPESSVAATKSYLGTLAAVGRLTAAWSTDEALTRAIDELPDALSSAWELNWSEARHELAEARGAFILGRGPTLGIAQEAALKFKETCGLHAEAFSTAEVEHGPMELITEGFPIVAFIPEDQSGAGCEKLLSRFVDRGASVFVTGRQLPGCRTLPIVPNLHPAVAPIAIAQSFYRLVNSVSVLKDRNPDRPAMLSKVTSTI